MSWSMTCASRAATPWCVRIRWLGFGAGVAAAIKAFGEPALKDLVQSWPFFCGLVADVEVVLGKADIEIAERYSELAGGLHEQFFPTIRAEFERSVQAVLMLKGQTRLLEHERTLRRTIRLRNPYVDPMSLLQIDLLRRWRESGSKDDAVYQALLVSVNGIAHGMQNTG
jgi:phosphoenolpyruvate carboxylase